MGATGEFSGFGESDLGWWADVDTPAAATVVAFGGIVNDPGVNLRFEFFRFFDQLPCRKIFVRDLDQCWYQRGIRGLGTDLRKSAEQLRAMAAGGTGPLFTVGASAGGYAAMVFGTLLGADHCLAFSPQSNLTRAFRLRHADLRWRHQIRRMRGSSTVAHLDVRALARPSTPIELYFARDNRLDAVHADHLRGADGVRVVARDGDGHNVVRDMRESGELRKIVDQIIDGTRGDQAS